MLSEYQSVVQTKTTTNSQLEDLAAAVNRLSLDDYHQLMKQLLSSIRSTELPEVLRQGRSVESSVETLTKRELEVLTLVASGYSRKEIGQVLSISENTAACHIASIYRKMDISTIAEATRIAIQCGAV